MENFVFSNPTKIIFGRGSEMQVGKEVAVYSQKILLLYGSGSIKSTGLYDRVVKSLQAKNIEIVELAGVKANPVLSLVYKGIRICREQNIEFILAVGGGSVIDSAKAIAAGVPYDGDVWDFYSEKAVVKQSLAGWNDPYHPGGWQRSQYWFCHYQRGWNVETGFQFHPCVPAFFHP